MYKKHIFVWNDASFINVINNNVFLLFIIISVSPDSESALESILEHTEVWETFWTKNLNDSIYLFVRRTWNWCFIFLLNSRYQSGPFKFDVAAVTLQLVSYWVRGQYANEVLTDKGSGYQWCF